MFHFSFQCFISKNTEGANQKHCGSDSKTQWERIKNTVGAIQKHNGSELKTLWERYKNTEGAITRSLSVLKSET